MKEKSLVSIITPCYNSEKYILDTITSVLKQTHQNWELLITDDGSNDKSVEIINKLKKEDSRIKLFKIKNSGPAVARNLSIQKAKGVYMSFLDSDDLWYPNFLERSIEECKKSEGFVCASYEMKNDSMEEVYPVLKVPIKVDYDSILKTNTISCLTAFIDIEKLGKEYMPNIKYRQDMGLWLTYLKKVNFCYGILETLAVYRIRDKSHSRNKFKLLWPQFQFYRNISRLSVISSLYYLLIWSYYGMKKYR